MIYPYEIPSNVESHAEKAIFSQLNTVKDEYDFEVSDIEITLVGKCNKHA